MKTYVSLRLSDTVISGFNCQQCTLTKLTIKEEKIKKKKKDVYIRKWSVTDTEYKKQHTFLRLWNKE